MPSPRFIKSHLPLQLLPTQLTTLKPKVCMHFFELELHSWLNTFYFRAHSLSLSLRPATSSHQRIADYLCGAQSKRLMCVLLSLLFAGARIGWHIRGIL